VTSGGVSVGLYDLVKEVLDGDRRDRVLAGRDAAGPPARVGRIGSAHFFGLPGNPVASMLTFMLFVRPAIHKLAGRRRLFPEVYEACATETMRKKKGRREFKRGVVRFRDGRWRCATTGPQGSGILSSMVAGNCLIVLEEERGDVAAGETVLVEPFWKPSRDSPITVELIDARSPRWSVLGDAAAAPPPPAACRSSPRGGSRAWAAAENGAPKGSGDDQLDGDWRVTRRLSERLDEDGLARRDVATLLLEHDETVAGDHRGEDA